jgi:hypothetical protein
MASTAIIQTCKQLNPKEEWLTDLDEEVYETTLTLGNLIEIKKQTHLDPQFYS